MKILWIGGNHRRHLYFINQISKSFEVCGAIIEKRESMIQQATLGCSSSDKKFFELHFSNRDLSELKYFGEQNFPLCPIIEVTEKNLNTVKVASFVKQIEPEVVIIFGCGLIEEPLLGVLPNETINLHLGISPRYRGAATLFWPFYYMEPWYAGATFHYIISEPDAGNIIHQIVPQLEKGDKIHDVACKVVLTATEEAKRLFQWYKSSGSWKQFRQKGTGKNFLSNDFRIEHLRVIYSLFNDDMVDRYLNGELSGQKPKLINQFL